MAPGVIDAHCIGRNTYCNGILEKLAEPLLVGEIVLPLKFPELADHLSIIVVVEELFQRLELNKTLQTVDGGHPHFRGLQDCKVMTEQNERVLRK